MLMDNEFFDPGALPIVGGLAKPVDFMRSNPPKQWRRDVTTQAGHFSVLGLFNYDEEMTIQEMVPLSEWGLAELSTL